MKRIARKSLVKEQFEKFKNLAYDLAHMQWYAIKSKGRMVGFEEEDLIQEALLQLCLSLSNRDVDEDRLLPYCYLTIKRKLINFTIYKGDLVRVPYYRHYANYQRVQSGKEDGVEPLFTYEDKHFRYCRDSCLIATQDDFWKGFKYLETKETYDEFLDLLRGLMVYAEEKFSHYLHKAMYLDIFLNLLVVKIKYNNEKDILYHFAEKYDMKEYRVWSIFRMMKKLMIDDAKIIDDILGTQCFTKLKKRRNKK